jgi:hypothetical protein
MKLSLLVCALTISALLVLNVLTLVAVRELSAKVAALEESYVPNDF